MGKVGDIKQQIGDKHMRKSGETKNKIIFVCTVLHDGWEMDNQAWVIELPDGDKQIMTTNHGGECVMSFREIKDKIDETQASLDGLLKLLEFATEIEGRK